jgi:hypothetical protein
VYHPMALHLAADLHDTEVTPAFALPAAFPPLLRAAVPGTSVAVRQRPFTSLARNGPPALQLPAEPHDTDWTSTLPPPPVPGICTAVCQVPPGAAAPAPAGTRVPAAAWPTPANTSGQTAAVTAMIMAAERPAAVMNPSPSPCGMREKTTLRLTECSTLPE